MIKTQNEVGRILVFRDPSEMIAEVKKGADAGRIKYNCFVKRGGYASEFRAEWSGRRFTSWADLQEKFHQPWPEGIATVKSMLEEMKHTDLPNPKDVRRKLTWNPDDGEIDVDRYMDGDENYMRRGIRRSTHAVRIVSILCQLGKTGGYSAEEIFWQGAAVVAAVDLLEQNGFSVEVNMFNIATYTYRTPPYESFVFCPIKEAGTEVNLDQLASSLSAWFFRNVVMASRSIHDPTVSGTGGSTQMNPSAYAVHMGTDSGCIPVQMESVASKEYAIRAVKKVIDQVTAEV